MKIEIWKIPDEGEQLEGEEPADIIDLPTKDHIQVIKPVAYSVWIQATSGEVIVKGTLKTRVRVWCSRCAEDIVLDIQDKGFEAIREYADRYDTVDLTPDIRDAMILAFPVYPVCSKDCKGLCPSCGQNFNRGSCQCRPPVEDRWAGLDQVKTKMEVEKTHGRPKKKKIEK